MSIRPVASLVSVLMVLSACAPNSNGPAGSSYNDSSVADVAQDSANDDFDENDPLGGWEEEDKEGQMDVPFDETVPEGTDAPDESSILESEKAISAMFENASTAVGGGGTNQNSGDSVRRYSHLDPQGYVPRDLLQEALNKFEENKGKFRKKNIIGIIDYAKHSSKRRFFIIDLRSGDVMALHVAHGRYSDLNHDGIADRFSNAPNSGMTSLGVYRASETYNGKHGLSLRLDGLSSTNSNARRRAVVIHAASYVVDSPVRQGRSLGCPAVSAAKRARVISALRDGAMIYAGRSGGKMQSREVPRVQKIPKRTYNPGYQGDESRSESIY